MFSYWFWLPSKAMVDSEIHLGKKRQPLCEHVSQLDSHNLSHSSFRSHDGNHPSPNCMNPAKQT